MYSADVIIENNKIAWMLIRIYKLIIYKMTE